MSATSSSSPTTTSTTTTPSLAEFLKQRKASPTRHLVIGNAAGDADSILSALCWAYVVSVAKKKKDTTTKNSHKDNDDQDATPIVSIPRRDLLTQRPETLFLLKLANIVPDDCCIHVDDVMISNNDDDNDNDDKKDSVLQGATVTLVDHNRLASTIFDHLNWTVTGILDHHYDEGLYMDTTTSATTGGIREIAFQENQATVASTTTLVTEHWAAAACTSSSLSSDVAILLLGTILLDSVNMQPSADKGTPRDQAAIDVLLSKTDWQDGKIQAMPKDMMDQRQNDGRPIPEKLFDHLQQAKFDTEFWKSLGVLDALRLDYKEFTPNNSDNAGDAAARPFGISTVLLKWELFVEKENVLEEIEIYMQNVNIEFLGIMCTYTEEDKEGLQRELILCAKNNSDLLHTMVENYLQKLDKEENLQLQEQPNKIDTTKNDSEITVRFFAQGKSKASRKQVAPILLRYFESCAASEWESRRLF